MSTTPKRLGKYELQARLGHGGVAEVWKALDTQLQRHVAIKILQPDLREDPNFITRFQREARFIASLHHPNIVQIHDFQVYQADELAGISIAYMVMDYVEGRTLADYIYHTSNQGHFPSASELVNIFTAISLAVDYAHQKGMIHRDIKPANILLDARNTTVNPMGEPVLTDFGVAKMLSATGNTLTGGQPGTPLYTSPEQARGYPGNERSDLYALGVILYEITTGTLPFKGNTPHDVLLQHMNSDPTAPELINPHITPALSHVIMRNLAKDPAARFSSAAMMTTALAEALQIPAPEILGHPSYPVADADHMPTMHITPEIQAKNRASLTPALSGQSNVVSQASEGSTPSFTPIMVQTASTSQQQAPPTKQPPTVNVTPPSTPAPKKKRRTGLYLMLAVLLLLALAASALGAYLLRPQPPVVAIITGHTYYLSSGQINMATSQGIADQLQIDLQNVPAPQPGQSYYAWLLGDKHPDTNPDLSGPRPVQPPLLISNDLPVHNGKIHYFYDGTQTNHNNLISNTSRMLITEQVTGQNPKAPPTDRATWRYYAEVPQDQIPGDSPGFSALTHIRHLFYDETNIKVLGLKGGLDFWLSHNAEKLVELSVSARDNWYGAQTNSSQMQLMDQLFVRILDYLDGAPNVHVDVPTNTPFLVDPLTARVAMLTVAPEQKVLANFDHDPFGYVDHTILHVGQIGKATDISTETRQHTAQIIDDLNRAGNYLQGVRQDAIKLFQITNNLNQTRQDSTKTLLDDMTSKALYAYSGEINPTTNQVQPAILQAHYTIQQLATLTLTANLPQQL